jgi:cell division protein FtsL
MIRSSGLAIQPIYQQTSNEADIKASCADITKAEKILKFVPKNKLNTDLKDIVTSTISTHV